MNMKVDQRTSAGDSLKWLVILVLIAAGIVANQYFSAQVLALRLVAGLFLMAITGFIALRTDKGRKALSFLRDARVELRKVVWPTRQETIQTTLIVAVMVIVVAFFLWGIDSVLLWLIGIVTGQKG